MLAPLPWLPWRAWLFETRAGKLDELEVWGGLVTCGEGAIREGKLTCTVKVTFDGEATSGDLKIALLTVAPDAPR